MLKLDCSDSVYGVWEMFHERYFLEKKKKKDSFREGNHVKNDDSRSK